MDPKNDLDQLFDHFYGFHKILKKVKFCDEGYFSGFWDFSG